MVRKVIVMLMLKTGFKFARHLMMGAPMLAALALVLTPPNAQSFPFSRKKAPPAIATAPATANPIVRTAPIEGPGSTGNDGVSGQGVQSTPPVPEVSASPAERLAARSLDLVAQSRFWMDELRKTPTDTEAAYEASTSLRAIGSSERAVQTAAMGIQSSANDPRLWSALALALVSNDQDEAAVQALQKAIMLNPRDARLQNSLGVVYDRLESPALAAIAYQAALVIAPGDSAILSNYGISVAMAGDLPRAESLLRQAVQNPIAPAQARQNLALVVGLQGRFPESEQLASRDLPPNIAADNVAYLRRMLNGGESRWSRAASSNN